LVGLQFRQRHTIGATLLYGQLLLFLLPLMKSKRWQRLSILFAAMLVMLVGFSRIALGAHYLSDVIAAIFLGVLWLMICALLVRADATERGGAGGCCGGRAAASDRSYSVRSHG
jgi:undecaprenyl-diphosphatase